MTKLIRMFATDCFQRIARLLARNVLKLPVPPRAALGLGAVFFRLRLGSAALLCLNKALAPHRKNPRKAAACAVPRGSNRPVRVSVIIPTYNRADSLARCLSSLERQTMKKECFEVIVVNNACTDHTEEVCEGYARKFMYFSVAREPLPGLLAARHAGWRAAAADVLVFCDDDVEAVPEWLESITAVFDGDPAVALVGGNNISVFEMPPPTWMDALWAERGGIRVNVYYSVLEGVDAPGEAPAPTLVFGCNYAIRRFVLEQAGGFEPDVMQHMLFQGGGETGIAGAIVAQGGKVFLHPGASVRHHMPASRICPEYLYKRGIYHGVETLYTYLRWGEGLPPWHGDHRHTNPALARFHDGFRTAQNAYVRAVLASRELRDWIAKPTYLGSEHPPDKALEECRELAGRFGW